MQFACVLLLCWVWYLIVLVVWLVLLCLFWFLVVLWLGVGGFVCAGCGCLRLCFFMWDVVYCCSVICVWVVLFASVVSVNSVVSGHSLRFYWCVLLCV